MMGNNKDSRTMAGDVNSAVIIKAVRHPANYKAIIFCSASLISVAMLMIVLGIVVLLIDHIEFGPPLYDKQYSRYAGSSLAPIVGPMLIGFGSLIIFGNIILLGYATRHYYLRSSSATNNNKIHVSQRGSSNSTRRKDIYGLV